jgi:hypothetical protein
MSRIRCAGALLPLLFPILFATYPTHALEKTSARGDAYDHPSGWKPRIR